MSRTTDKTPKIDHPTSNSFINFMKFLRKDTKNVTVFMGAKQWRKMTPDEKRPFVMAAKEVQERKKQEREKEQESPCQAKESSSDSDASSHHSETDNSNSN